MYASSATDFGAPCTTPEATFAFGQTAAAAVQGVHLHGGALVGEEGDLLDLILLAADDVHLDAVGLDPVHRHLVHLVVGGGAAVDGAHEHAGDVDGPAGKQLGIQLDGDLLHLFELDVRTGDLTSGFCKNVSIALAETGSRSSHQNDLAGDIKQILPIQNVHKRNPFVCQTHL